MTLTLELATTVVDAALAERMRSGFRPLCVAVLDAGGNLLVLKRNEQASVYRPQIAIGKAAGCIGMGLGGRELARRAAEMPAFFSALTSILPDGIVPAPGGVLIRSKENALLGAIGISGDTSENDEICALAGIAAGG